MVKGVESFGQINKYTNGALIDFYRAACNADALL